MHYHNQFKNNSDNIKATWKTIKDILHKNRKSNENPTKFFDNGEEFTTPRSIADGLNLFFTSVGAKLAEEIDTEGMPDVLSYMGEPRPERFFFQYTDTDKIKKYIKAMKSKSSSGDDEISSIFLKNESVLSALAPCLTILINQSLCTGIFPTRLKLAKVIPLYKNKGDDFKFENYRPISLLSAISKIYERVVFDQIYDYLQSNKLFYSNQYGFRRKHSTETAGLELFDRALKDVDQQNDPFAIFLDLSKAFDTIDHSILLRKLKHYGIHGTALRWFESYLTDRIQYVFYENIKSRPMRITTGVPQGSILGPLLFLICINDIKKCTDLFEVIGYADDTTLYGTLRKFAAATPRGGNIIKTTNEEIEKVNIWLKVNKLSLNPSKTRFMIFHHHQRKKTAVDLTKFEGGKDKICIDNVPIKKVPVFNFLGIEIHTNLKWNSHIDKIAGKVGKGLGILNKLKRFLPRNILVMIYNTLIQSHINFGILLWGQDPQRLVTMQKKAIRAVTSSKYNSHTEMSFKHLKILKIQDIFKLRCLKFLYSIRNGLVPDYFKETAGDEPNQIRTKSASRSLDIYLRTEIIPNTPNNILEKIYTHSYDGFSKYIKSHFLSQYKACELGPANCYHCGITRAWWL